MFADKFLAKFLLKKPIEKPVAGPSRLQSLMPAHRWQDFPPADAALLNTPACWQNPSVGVQRVDQENGLLPLQDFALSSTRILVSAAVCSYVAAPHWC
eukprot:g65702.t1